MRIIFSCLMLLAATSAVAQDVNMKPGLWQHTMRFESESGQMEQALEQVRQQLQALPPEQQQMMKDMMKKQGVDFDFANQSFKNCLSEDEARQGDFDMSENEDCETTNIAKSGGATTLHFSCDGDSHTGEGTITFESDKRYSGESHATVDMQGQPEKMTINHEGEWLGDDCGDLAKQ